MSLTRLIFFALVALLIAACAAQPTYNRYQQKPAVSKGGSSAVAELQRSARAALDDGAYAQAVEYLQRAIKIEPRDPFSWHYLAETYRRSGDNRRCSEMVERSFSYSVADDALDIANRELRERCL